VDHDCIIIGAGFAGLRALIEAHRRGLSARVIEAGTDVGGTWYWNRYPGARTDSESWVYCYSFDDELLQDWVWEDRFPDQMQVQKYLAHVADRFDLRKDIDFCTRAEKVTRDDATNSWTVRTDAGVESTCTYLISAVGLLSASYEPPFPGVESFKGERYLSSHWPKEEIDFAGKRVGVIGTGASAVQLIPLVAQTAGSLTVFQRTPNFVMPARNCPLDKLQRDAIKNDYPAIWEKARGQVFGFPMDTPGRTVAETEESERQRILERGWETGGFRFLFETFDDIFTDQYANDVAAEFVRNKIRAIVRDPETAERLCPKNHPLGSKRPPLGHYYYETYNRETVSLVDVSGNPIESITESGVHLTDGSEYEFDVLIYATGFDAATGALTAIDIRGSDGQSLAESWRTGARTALSMAVSGFPNMFLIGGPGCPFGNNPPITEFSADWIGDAISHMKKSGADVMEATPEAMDEWAHKLQDIIDQTVLGQGEAVNTWFLGANIPGKAHVPLFYMGGVPNFVADLEAAAEQGYPGFTLSSAGAAVS
jgi:cyclohexanone monooxygenase